MVGRPEKCQAGASVGKAHRLAVLLAMPMLRNPRHERFAQALAKGLSGKAAYVEAGFRARDHAAEVEGSKLLRKPEVSARIAELQARQVRRLDVTVETICQELEAARAGAMAARQYSAATAASLGKAKLLGLITDKAEIETTVRRPMRDPGAVRQMSLQEWEERFKPKASAPQQGNDKPATKPEKAEPEDAVRIIDAIRQAKAARRVKSGST